MVRCRKKQIFKIKKIREKINGNDLLRARWESPLCQRVLLGSSGDDEDGMGTYV